MKNIQPSRREFLASASSLAFSEPPLLNRVSEYSLHPRRRSRLRRSRLLWAKANPNAGTSTGGRGGSEIHTSLLRQHCLCPFTLHSDECKHTGHCATRGNRHPEIPVPMSDPTIAEVLKRAGYRTAHYGKWGLGGPETTSTPTERGFDEFFGFSIINTRNQAYPDYLWEGRVETMLPKNWFYRKQQYVPEMFTDRTLKFIDQPSDKPFFVYLSQTVPHADNELPGIEVPDQGPYAKENWPEIEKNFAASITRMDSGIGRILDLLKRKKLDQNTLVIFTSDNGPHKEGGHSADFFGSRGGLRGVKRDMYEGGIRVPAVARWPGRAKPGTTSDAPGAFWDVLPTLAEVVGLKAPPGIDGASFLRALEDQPQPPHAPFYWEFHEGGFQQAVREGDWKLVRQLPKFSSSYSTCATI